MTWKDLTIRSLRTSYIQQSPQQERRIKNIKHETTDTRTSAKATIRKKTELKELS